MSETKFYEKKIEFPEMLPDMFRFYCNEQILGFLVNQLRDDVRIGYSHIIFNNCPRFRKHDIRHTTKHMHGQNLLVLFS